MKKWDKNLAICWNICVSYTTHLFHNYLFSAILIMLMENKNIMNKESENVLGADNQQERLDAQWIVGFVDGEGCFHIAISRLSKMTLGWQVLPEFRIVQHQRDVALLYQIKNYFGFGIVGRNHGDRQELRVRGRLNLEKLILFFKQHPLKSVKKHDFEFFCQVFEMMKQKEHLNKE